MTHSFADSVDSTSEADAFEWLQSQYSTAEALESEAAESTLEFSVTSNDTSGVQLGCLKAGDDEPSVQKVKCCISRLTFVRGSPSCCPVCS